MDSEWYRRGLRWRWRQCSCTRLRRRPARPCRRDSPTPAARSLLLCRWGAADSTARCCSVAALANTDASASIIAAVASGCGPLGWGACKTSPSALVGVGSTVPVCCCTPTGASVGAVSGAAVSPGGMCNRACTTALGSVTTPPAESVSVSEALARFPRRALPADALW